MKFLDPVVIHNQKNKFLDWGLGSSPKIIHLGNKLTAWRLTPQKYGGLGGSDDFPDFDFLVISFSRVCDPGDSIRDLFGRMSLRDPNSKVVSVTFGDKRSSLESPGLKLFSSITLPETKTMAPENCWLEDD